MDEEPIEEFILLPNISNDRVPAPPCPPAPPSAPKVVWTPLACPPIPPQRKPEEKKDSDPIQPMEAPTVPKAPSRRCRPAKSRESPASSRPLTESDSAEPAASSPKIPDESQNASKADDSISAEIFQHMESNCFRNTTHNVVSDENVILDNSGISSQLNESMGSLAAGYTPSKPKKMHWKTKQKLENLEKKRLKALINDRMKSPKDNRDAGGSQEGSTDDSLTTSDSTVTDSGKKKRKRKIYVSNHTPSGRKSVPTDRYSPSPFLPSSSTHQETSPAPILDIIATYSGISHNAPSAHMTINPEVSPKEEALMPPKEKKPRYAGERLTEAEIEKSLKKNNYNASQIKKSNENVADIDNNDDNRTEVQVDNNEEATGSFLDQEAGALEPEDDDQLSPDVSLESTNKKRKKRGSKKPWTTKYAKKLTLGSRKTITRKEQSLKVRRRTQLDMLLEDPLAQNGGEIGAQRTRKQINHTEVTASPSAPPQPSPAEDLEMSQQYIPQDSINGQFDAKPLAPSSSIQGTSFFSTNRRRVIMSFPVPPIPPPKVRNSPQQQQQPQETMQKEVPQQVAAQPPAEKFERHLRPVKKEAASPPRAPPQVPLVPFPRPPAQLNFMPAPPRLAPLPVVQPQVAPPLPPMPIRVKAEPEDNDNNDCVIVGVSSAASTSSDASGSHSNRFERRPAAPQVQAAPPAPVVPQAPLAPAMGYITPEHITVDAALAEIRTLYNRLDPAFLFLFHGEVKRYITALANPPGRR